MMVACDGLAAAFAQRIIAPSNFNLPNGATTVAITIFAIWLCDLYKIQEASDLQRSILGAIALTVVGLPVTIFLTFLAVNIHVA